MSGRMKIGVDEAGRGSVIGPLVVCSFASISQTELLELGVKDSKDLSKKERRVVSNTGENATQHSNL